MLLLQYKCVWWVLIGYFLWIIYILKLQCCGCFFSSVSLQTCLHARAFSSVFSEGIHQKTSAVSIPVEVTRVGVRVRGVGGRVLLCVAGLTLWHRSEWLVFRLLFLLGKHKGRMWLSAYLLRVPRWWTGEHTLPGLCEVISPRAHTYTRTRKAPFIHPRLSLPGCLHPATQLEMTHTHTRACTHVHTSTRTCTSPYARSLESFMLPSKSLFS